MLLLFVVQWISNGHSQSPQVLAPIPVYARGDAKAEKHHLFEQAAQYPSAYAYTQLCLFYERQGEYRKALFCLRTAETLAKFEEIGD